MHVQIVPFLTLFSYKKNFKLYFNLENIHLNDRLHFYLRKEFTAGHFSTSKAGTSVVTMDSSINLW